MDSNLKNYLIFNIKYMFAKVKRIYLTYIINLICSYMVVIII